MYCMITLHIHSYKSDYVLFFIYYYFPYSTTKTNKNNQHVELSNWRKTVSGMDDSNYQFFYQDLFSDFKDSQIIFFKQAWAEG